MSKVAINKGELIEMIAEEAELSKAQATKALSAILDGITGTLQKGGQVSILGFGTFVVKARGARTVRNPQTGAPIDVPASNVPAFKAGKGLKDAVNSGTTVKESA